jgi:hypothetical protein
MEQSVPRSVGHEVGREPGRSSRWRPQASPETASPRKRSPHTALVGRGVQTGPTESRRPRGLHGRRLGPLDRVRSVEREQAPIVVSSVPFPTSFTRAAAIFTNAHTSFSSRDGDHHLGNLDVRSILTINGNTVRITATFCLRDLSGKPG